MLGNPQLQKYYSISFKLSNCAITPPTWNQFLTSLSSAAFHVSAKLLSLKVSLPHVLFVKDKVRLMLISGQNTQQVYDKNLELM